MVAGIYDFVLETQTQFRQRLRQHALPLYVRGDLAAARHAVDVQLDKSLQEIADAFGFPDAAGMSIMAMVTADAGYFMIEASDIIGAQELAGRSWAFCGDNPIAELKAKIKDLSGK